MVNDVNMLYFSTISGFVQRIHLFKVVFQLDMIVNSIYITQSISWS